MLLIGDFIDPFHDCFVKVCYEMVHWSDVDDLNYQKLEQQYYMLKKALADLLNCLLSPISDSYLLKSGLTVSEYKKVILLIFGDSSCNNIKVCYYNW